MIVVVAALGWAWADQVVPLPARADSLKFAVIGDNGTGETPQYEVGRQMAKTRGTFPFEFVLMLGDNMYGRQEPRDFVDKFERPYAELLKAGVPFYAALGNHDDPDNRFYPGFHMNGERYYTFVRQSVRFFVFDTNLLDRPQQAWIERTLRAATEPWRIAYFHTRCIRTPDVMARTSSCAWCSNRYSSSTAWTSSSRATTTPTSGSRCSRASPTSSKARAVNSGAATSVPHPRAPPRSTRTGRSWSSRLPATTWCSRPSRGSARWSTPGSFIAAPRAEARLP